MLIALTGCATNFETKPLPTDHPASAAAQEGPRTGMKRLIMSDPLTQKTKAQLARNTVPDHDYQSSGMSHDMGGMKGMDHSKMERTPPVPIESKTSPAPITYTCVMHPEVQQSTPGNCPKCGMTLVKKENAAP